MRKKRRNILTLLLAFILMLSMTACAASGKTEAPAEPAETEAEPGTEETGDAAAAEETEEAQEPQAEKNGEIYILCTSDVHCGVDQGFGYAGLSKIRDTLEAKGFETILVDDGDSIQGEPIGTVSKGENIIDLMNAIGYDVAIPGNHEFDYGTDRFLELTGKAEFPYISCNFTYQDEPVFKPYVILEAAGKKIAFVGVTTPLTVRSSTPAYFMDDEGNYVYGFMMDESGEKVYQAVQGAVDAAREEGADFVFAMAHLGNEEECRPWTYADVIANTSGIDVFLDGHSHDTDQVVMKNKNGEDVTRSAVGTKMSCIGYTHISAEGEIAETGIWTWSNKISAPELLDIQGELRDKVDMAKKELDEEMNRVVATAEVRLTIEDPEEKDANGKPIRMVRRAETNLGDLSADAYRDQSGADIALVNGGGVRANIEKGDVTFGNIISVHPFGNMLCVIEVTGQQILDALEWGSRAVPGENGGFLQTSGLTYEINTQVDSPCLEDENGMFAGIEGTRRVQNVMVGEEPIDPEKVYTLASHNYMLLERGDGYTMFDGAEVLQDSVKLDNQVLIDYIVDSLNGVIGGEYADPYGQGRIKVLE